MTLVLTLRDKGYILQVTDRLLTKQGAPVDPLANKNILFHGRNGIVTLGYTGWAYLEGIPTDQWIAEKLTGQEYDRNKTEHGFGFNPPEPSLDIGLSVLRLREALQTMSNGLSSRWQEAWKKDRFAILLGGCQWNSKGRVRPILGVVLKPRRSDQFHVIWEERNNYLFAKNPYTVSHEPLGNMKIEERKHLLGKLRAAQNWDQAEAALISTVHDVARRTPIVGAHCMSILITPPAIGKVRVRFVPALPQMARLTSNAGEELEVPIAFSPWFIGPNLNWSPAVLTGGNWSMQIGNYNLSLEAPRPSSGPLYGFLRSQPRPKL